MKKTFKLAYDALIDLGAEDYEGFGDVLDALEEALAQPEHEPVAMRHSFDGYGYKYTDMGFGGDWIGWTRRQYKDAERLYTTPPQRTWVGLTDEEAHELWESTDSGDDWELMKRTEAKLKEKNA